MNQRTKKVNETLAGGSPGKLTSEEVSYLESIHLTPEGVKANKALVTVNASPEAVKLCESIVSKLFPGEDPDRMHVNVVLSKHSPEQ